MPATPHTPGSSSGVGISKLACSPSQYPNNNLSGGGMNSNAQHQQQQVKRFENILLYWESIMVKRKMIYHIPLITFHLVFDGQQPEFYFMSPQQSIYGQWSRHEFKISLPK